MKENLKNQDSGSVRVEITPTLRDAGARVERVLDFCRQHVLELPAPPKDACWHAGQALLRVMHDQLDAARLYAQKHPDRPSPVMVSVRPIYEAMLYLLYLLRPDSAEERRALGLMFWQFSEWEQIEGISKAPGGLEAYQKWLSKDERPILDSRLEIANEAEAQFTREQKRQLKRGRWNVTWTGKTIAQLAKELEKEQEHTFHRPWYGVMSMATHVSPGMIHWSYKLIRGQVESDQHALNCRERSAEWLNRGSVEILHCALRFADRYGLDISDKANVLLQELNAINGSPKDQEQNEKAVREDPVIRDLVDRIVQAVDPLRIILFGSAGLDDPGANDFDLLVIVRDRANLGKAEDDMYRSMWGFPMPTDLIAVTEEDVQEHAAKQNHIIQTAMKEGKEIYRAAG